MQFFAIAASLLALAGSTLAGREDTIKAGLRIVGNQAGHDYHSSRKAADHDFNHGSGLHVGSHNAQAAKHKDVNNRIGSTVKGVPRVHRRELDGEGMMLVGRDDTHEYFARDLEHPASLFARDAEADDFWYEY